MHPSLQSIFDKLENDQLEMFEQVSALTSDKYHFRMASDKWSIAEILTHLLTSERMSLSYMRKKFNDIQTLRNTNYMASVKFLLLKVSQRLPIKFRAPAFLIQSTPKPLDQQQLVAEWIALRQELRSFLEQFPAESIYKEVYKHHVVGKLNVMQALQFFSEHIHHHWPQVKRLLKQ